MRKSPLDYVKKHIDIFAKARVFLRLLFGHLAGQDSFPKAVIEQSVSATLAGNNYLHDSRAENTLTAQYYNRFTIKYHKTG